MGGREVEHVHLVHQDRVAADVGSLEAQAHLIADGNVPGEFKLRISKADADTVAG